MISAVVALAADPAACQVKPATQASVAACLDTGMTSLGTKIGQGASSVAGTGVGAVISWLVDWIEGVMADVATSVASFWTSVPTVSVGDQTGKASDSVQFVQDSLRYYTLAIAVLSLVFGGVFLAFKGRTTLPQLGMFLVRIVAMGGLITGACALLIYAADQYSQWVIPAANNGSNLGANLATLFASGTGPVQFICLVVELLSSLFLVAMMWVRSAVLVLLVGTVGLAAACWSPAYLAKQAKLIVVVIAVQPLAATEFAVGFRLLGSNVGATGVTEPVVGAVILFLSCWSWKFLVKIIAPYDDPMPGTGLGGLVARAAAFAALAMR